MTVYHVISKATGAKVYEYAASAPVEWSGFDFTTHDHVAQPDAPAPAPAAIVSVKITKLAFRNRFSGAEKVAIELAAADNPAAPMAQRQLAAALRAQLADQRDATHIDLGRADTRAGVQQLEAAGLLGPGRAAVILDTPAADNEVYSG